MVIFLSASNIFVATVVFPLRFFFYFIFLLPFQLPVFQVEGIRAVLWIKIHYVVGVSAPFSTWAGHFVILLCLQPWRRPRLIGPISGRQAKSMTGTFGALSVAGCRLPVAGRWSLVAVCRRCFFFFFWPDQNRISLMAKTMATESPLARQVFPISPLRPPRPPFIRHT